MLFNRQPTQQRTTENYPTRHVSSVEALNSAVCRGCEGARERGGVIPG